MAATPTRTPVTLAHVSGITHEMPAELNLSSIWAIDALDPTASTGTRASIGTALSTSRA